MYNQTSYSTYNNAGYAIDDSDFCRKIEYDLDMVEDMLGCTTNARSSFKPSNARELFEDDEEPMDTSFNNDEELDQIYTNEKDQSHSAISISDDENDDMEISPTSSPIIHNLESGKYSEIKPFQLSQRNSNSTVAVERVKKELEQKFKEECTFRPKINKNYTSTKMSGVSQQDRWAILSNNKQSEYIRREQEKLRKEHDKIQSDCFFRPKTQGSHDGINRKPDHCPHSFFDRLSKEAQEKLNRRELAKLQQEKKEAEQYSFEPRIGNQRFVKETYMKPQEKAGMIMRQKHEKLRQLEVKHQEDPELTFTPQISGESVRIATKNREPMSVFDRTRFLENQRRLQRQTDQQLRQKEAECTFRPSVNPKSQQIIQNSKLYSGNNNTFFERQQIMRIREERIKRALKDKENIDSEKMFIPQVNKTSKLLATITRGEETPEEKAERLSKADLKKKEELQETLKKQFYDQFSFQPKLNPVSKEIGNPTNREELVRNERNKRVKQHLAEVHAQEWRKEHKFQPTLVSNHYQVTESKYKLIDPKNPEVTAHNIQRYHDAREQKLNRAKKELECHELQNCTFQPKVHRSKTPPIIKKSGPVIIRGLGKHLERRERAKKIEEEKKEREEQVFRPRTSRPDPKLPYTIPEPFQNLHPDNYSSQREIRRMELVDKYYREEMKQYTFQPQTNIRQDNKHQLSYSDLI